MSNLLLFSCLAIGLGSSLASGVVPTGGKLVPEAVQVDSIGATKIMRSEPIYPEARAAFADKTAEVQNPFTSYTLSFSYPPSNPRKFCLAVQCCDAACTDSCLVAATCNEPPTEDQVFMIAAFTNQGTTAALGPLQLTSSMIYWNGNDTSNNVRCLAPHADAQGNTRNVSTILTTSGYVNITVTECCNSHGAYSQVWNYTVDATGQTYLTLADNNRGSNTNPTKPACLTYGDPGSKTFHMFPCTGDFDGASPSTYATQKFAITPTQTTAAWQTSTLACSR